MTSISDLIERVKGLSGPDRESDYRIAVAADGLEWHENEGQAGLIRTAPLGADRRHDHQDIGIRGADGVFHEYGGGRHYFAPRYTASLDAALVLADRVLPGWHWVLRSSPPFEALVMCPEARPGRREFGTAIAPTAPLALLLAILEAKGEMS